MKLIFNLAMLLAVAMPFVGHSKGVILLTHFQRPELARLAETLMERDWQIPASLIQLRERRRPCRPRPAVVHLCLNSEGRLEAVKLDRPFIDQSLPVFRELPDA